MTAFSNSSAVVSVWNIVFKQLWGQGTDVGWSEANGVKSASHLNVKSAPGGLTELCPLLNEKKKSHVTLWKSALHFKGHIPLAQTCALQFILYFQTLFFLARFICVHLCLNPEKTGFLWIQFGVMAMKLRRAPQTCPGMPKYRSFRLLTRLNVGHRAPILQEIFT